MPFNKTTILDIPFINTTNKKFIEQLSQDLKNNTSKFIVTANPEIAVYAHNHPDYLKIIKTADYITPDGIGIIKGAKKLNLELTERITGYDTMMSLLEVANKEKYSIYLLGATSEVLEKTVANVSKEFPNLSIAGSHNGFFNDKEEKEIIEEIKKTQPKMVFAALGFPKQEILISKNKAVTNGIWMGVGGSFDVISGSVSRAPKIWQNMHLEWLYRYLSHPSRLKRFPTLIEYMRLLKKY